MKRVTVIGAGLSGLATAAWLARHGCRVQVLEKNDDVGGRIRVAGEEGFTFDMGPTWYLMREVFDEFFAVFGKTSDDYFQLRKLEPCFRVFFESGRRADVSSHPEQLKRLFAELEPRGAEKLERYLAEARFKYDVAMQEFLYRDYQRLTHFLNRRMLTQGLKLNVFQSLDRYAAKFFDNPQARQILLYNIVFLGGTPRNSPALYSLMSHVDLNLGVYYPLGGMWKLPRALYELCLEQRVEFRFGHEVLRLETHAGRVARIHCRNASFSADAVVSTAEYPHTETALLRKADQTYPASYWKRKRMAPSMFLLYLGLQKELRTLEHHNFFFPDNWDPHFETIRLKSGWPDNPAYYVGYPSRTDTTLAPPGKSVLFVLVPVAAGLDDTPRMRESYADKILGHLEQIAGEEIRPSIQVKKVFAHNDFTHLYHACQGTALGLAHTLFQSAVFRPGNQSKKIKNLYYAGQYTHPGIGMPMALISAQITARKLMRSMS